MDMCTNCIVFSLGGERDCLLVYYTNFIVFLLDENKILDMCTNFVVFHQEEKEILDMCTNIIVFL